MRQPESPPEPSAESKQDAKPELQKRTLRQLTLEILRERALFFWGSFFILAATGSILAEPQILIKIIDNALLPRDWRLLRTYGFVLLGIEVIRVSSMIAQAYFFQWLGQNVMQRLRLALLAHLQALPLSIYDRTPTGSLVTRVTNDVGALAEMFSSGFVTIIANFLTVAGIAAMLLWMNLRLGLAALLIFPVLIALSVHFSGRLRIAYRDQRSKLSLLNAFLAENILGMRIVHLFNRQGHHIKRFRAINQRYTDAQVDSVKVFALFQPTITIAAGMSMALVIAYGGKMTVLGTIKVGVLVAYFSYVQAVFQPIREIADKWNVFLSGMASAERIFAILDWKPEMPVEETLEPAQVLEGVRGHIVFENVWFAYTDEHWVLRDLSCEILPGQRVGVVGHTGAGKTTLIGLLMRFYEPQRGRILLDGKDLRDYDRRALRSAIGIVQQDVFLFAGSTDENITLWSEPGARSREQVGRALEEISPQGPMKELDERGSNLSMGERQVLSFARALSSEPKIWILDEATANIDSESEARIGLALDRAARERTMILIAHRLATVRSSDLILVLHKGVLVESGNHSALISRDGLYAKLFRYQDAFQVQEAAAGPGPQDSPRP